MRLCYILLSPTFGMHQYTADLANRMVSEHQVDLITSFYAPDDRYNPGVTIHKLVAFNNTGLSLHTTRIDKLMAILALLHHLQPDVVHFSGPHLWNEVLARWLRGRGVRVIHTIHDLDPHAGRRFGSLLGVWNRSIMAQVDRIVLHGQCYYQRLAAQSPFGSKLYYLPLLHLFVSHAREQKLLTDQSAVGQNSLEPVATDYLLFFGRLQLYKGVADLLTAFAQVMDNGVSGHLILAGPGELPEAWHKRLPEQVSHRNYLIEDEEAVTLFQNCRAVVLPYISATQSALVAAAYFFGKPVIVTDSGALSEYVDQGETGFVVPVRDRHALAEKIEYALRCPDQMARMGVAGRQWYNKQRLQESEALYQLYDEEFRRSSQYLNGR